MFVVAVSPSEADLLNVVQSFSDGGHPRSLAFPFACSVDSRPYTAGRHLKAPDPALLSARSRWQRPARHPARPRPSQDVTIGSLPRLPAITLEANPSAP